MKKTYPCKVDIFIDFCKSNTELCYQKFILDMRKSLYEKSLVNLFDGEYYTEIFNKAFHALQVAFNSTSSGIWQKKSL